MNQRPTFSAELSKNIETNDISRDLFTRFNGFEHLSTKRPPTVLQLRKRFILARLIRGAACMMLLALSFSSVVLMRSGHVETGRIAQLPGPINAELPGYRVNLVWTELIPIMESSGGAETAIQRWESRKIILPLDSRLLDSEQQAVVQSVLYQPEHSQFSEL